MPATRQRAFGRAAATSAALLALLCLLVWADVAAASSLTPPTTIKVARRFPANDPHGTIYRVDTVDFRTYCVRVLSHEWAPASAFSDQALRAGALAVKSYGWYWATHETKLADVRASGADVDDSVNYQVYMDSDYGSHYWSAVNDTWGLVLTKGGAVFQASYYAGSLSGAASDGYHMTQWGTQYWATRGKTFDWMIGFYYRGVGLTKLDAESSGVVMAPALTGPPSLEVVGPVELDDAPFQLHENLHASFTLRNAGARAGRWDQILLVARGPNGENRDLGAVSDVRLRPGQYMRFGASRILDLPGRWTGWLVARKGHDVTLIGDGATFHFRVKTQEQLRVPLSENESYQRHSRAPARKGSSAVLPSPQP